MSKKIMVNAILFNLTEIICVMLVGLSLNIKIKYVIIITFLFPTFRFIFKKPMHYKSPYLCFLITLSMFSTLFLLLKIDLIVSIILTIFSSYILTNNANIYDMFMWTGKKTQYQDIIDYIKYNPLNSKIKEFEDKIQEQDNLSYLIYKYRFKDMLTFAEISKRLDIETNRITEIQDKVAFTFRVFIGL